MLPPTLLHGNFGPRLRSVARRMRSYQLAMPHEVVLEISSVLYALAIAWEDYIDCTNSIHSQQEKF